MDGADEARARATLLEMQVRLSQGPHIALGIAELSTPDQVRRAFLELTKQFHPARFGRMSSELQRMSNEVFLGIKSAHEQMLRTLGSSVRPRANGSSAGVPTVTQSLPAGSSGVRQSSQPVPVVRATGQIPPLRASSTQAPSNQHTRPLTPPGARITPPTGVPITRTPAVGSPQVPRTLTPAGRAASPTNRPASPAGRAPTPPRAGELDPPTARNPGVAGQPRTPAPPFDERAAFDEASALLGRREWSAARAAFHALAVRMPQSRQYRALLCYSRGREAVAAGKVDDAAMEYQRALQLDPELAQAKQALAEIRRR